MYPRNKLFYTKKFRKLLFSFLQDLTWNLLSSYAKASIKSMTASHMRANIALSAPQVQNWSFNPSLPQPFFPSLFSFLFLLFLRGPHFFSSHFPFFSIHTQLEKRSSCVWIFGLFKGNIHNLKFRVYYFLPVKIWAHYSFYISLN